jgi:hypothetical protein
MCRDHATQCRDPGGPPDLSGKPEPIMAELHVEKKKKSNTMWIVLGVLLVALIAWMATRGNDVDDARTTQGTTTGALPAATAPIAAPILLNS